MHQNKQFYSRLDDFEKGVGFVDTLGGAQQFKTKNRVSKGKSPPKLCIIDVVQLFFRTASAQSFEQGADVIHIVHDIFCGAAVYRVQITDSGGKQDAV